ncbi:MAG: hypothetical protein ACI4PF_03770 [Christensenellales bacterium]
MLIDTPYGKAEVPDCYTNEYEDKTDIELLETLLQQNTTGNGFIDPILVQMLSDKELIHKGETFRQLEKRVKK